MHNGYMEGRIFIGYSRRDIAAVKPIKEELEANGFSCWMDLEAIESASEDFTAYIAAVMERTSVSLFFLSANSQFAQAQWFFSEAVTFASRKT